MNFQDPLTIILSLSALGAVLLWIIIMVVRVVFSAFAEEVKRRKTKREVEHPKFGALQGEMEIWSGTAKVEGREVRFSIGGTVDEPDERLLQQLEAVMANFHHFEKVALDYLHKENPSSTPLKFDFEDIDLLYPEDPDQFTLNFRLEGDEDGTWRVEFEKTQPVFTGRDD